MQIHKHHLAIHHADNYLHCSRAERVCIAPRRIAMRVDTSVPIHLQLCLTSFPVFPMSVACSAADVAWVIARVVIDGAPLICEGKPSLATGTPVLYTMNEALI